MDFDTEYEPRAFIFAAYLLLSMALGYKLGSWAFTGEFRVGWLDLGFVPLVVLLAGAHRHHRVYSE